MGELDVTRYGSRHLSWISSMTWDQEGKVPGHGLNHVLRKFCDVIIELRKWRLQLIYKKNNWVRIWCWTWIGPESKHDRQCTYKPGVEACLRNDRYRGKAVLHISSMCVLP
jgi:hypothetical protein